jgi:hypothetical protein
VALLRGFGVDPAGIDAATATRLAQALDEVQDLQACVDGLDGACEDLGEGQHDHSLTLPIQGEQTETWSTATPERSVTLAVTTSPDGSVQRRLRYSDVCGTVIEGSNDLNDDEATAPSPQQAPEEDDEEGLLSFFEGAIAGDLADNDSWSAIAGQTLVGFIPIAGQLADIRDTAAALDDFKNDEPGSGWGLAATLIAFIPGLDFLKAGRRTLKKIAGGIVPGAAESLVTKNLDDGVEAAGELGEEVVEQGAKQGADALTDEVRARFVAALGEEATERILKRFGAKAMAHYGPEFLGSLRGVTGETMEHLKGVVKVEDHKIVGCHDEQAFLDFVRTDGRWAVTGTTPHPDHPLVTMYEYRPYKKDKTGAFVDPKEFKASKPFVKSVIRGLVADEMGWTSTMKAAFDESIRNLSISKTDVRFYLEVNGIKMKGYLQDGVVATLFPLVPGDS